MNATTIRLALVSNFIARLKIETVVFPARVLVPLLTFWTPVAALLWIGWSNYGFDLFSIDHIVNFQGRLYQGVLSFAAMAIVFASLVIFSVDLILSRPALLATNGEDIIFKRRLAVRAADIVVGDIKFVGMFKNIVRIPIGPSGNHFDVPLFLVRRDGEDPIARISAAVSRCKSNAPVSARI